MSEGNPDDLKHFSTRGLLRLRYEGYYDREDVIAELNTREHVPNKVERQELARIKHRNGRQHEKKRMRFARDGSHVIKWPRKKLPHSHPARLASSPMPEAWKWDQYVHDVVYSL